MPKETKTGYIIRSYVPQTPGIEDVSAAWHDTCDYIQLFGHDTCPLHSIITGLLMLV